MKTGSTAGESSSSSGSSDFGVGRDVADAFGNTGLASAPASDCSWSFTGVAGGFFLPGIVNKLMPPKRRACSVGVSFPSSSAFFAASSTLKDSSLEVPFVWRLMCAACDSLLERFFMVPAIFRAAS